MRFLIPVFLLTLEALSAQRFSFRFPPALKQYLELTDQQVAEIENRSARLEQFRSEKQQRQFAVRLEISQETGRPSVDSMALGVRYLELETIRRELEAEAKKAVEEVQARLTAAQKLRLNMLEEVLRQTDTACAAVSWNLMAIPAPTVIAALVPPGLVPTSAFSFGGFVGGQSGCPFQPALRIFDPVLFQGNQK